MNKNHHVKSLVILKTVVIMNLNIQKTGLLMIALMSSIFISGCGNSGKMNTDFPFPSDSSKSIITGGDCHIDSINSEPGEGPQTHSINHNSPPFLTSGWAAISIKEGITTSDIALSLRKKEPENVRFFQSVNKVKRQDVADYFKSPLVIDSGFKAMVDLSNVAPGEYLMEVLQLRNNVVYSCQYNANLIIK